VDHSANRSSRLGQTVALLGAVVLLDAAVETAWSGASVRWWVVGSAALYAVVTAATWFRPIDWRGRLTIALLVFLGVAGATAWLPAGSTDGLRVIGLPTTTVLAALIAAGVVVAGFAVARASRIPILVRIAFGAFAAYGAAAFVLGAVSRLPIESLLAGHSIWERLPTLLQGAFVGGLVVLPVGLAAAAVRAGLRRPQETSVQAVVWRLAAIATSLAIVLSGMPLISRSRPAVSAGNNTSAEGGGVLPASSSASALANSFRAIQDGERESSRERWDPAYVVSRLGTDPQRLYSWVKLNTFWVPYRGLLRGPVGVLMDRLGNGLDRAVLLARLLREANYPATDVRLAHGRLPQELAVRRLPPLVTARGRPVPRVEGGDTLGAFAAEYQLDEASLRRTLGAHADTHASKQALIETRAPAQAGRLAAAVAYAPADWWTLLNGAISTLQDHWWVQLRRDGAWQDLDLLGPSNGASLIPPTETFGLDDLPLDLSHQVVIRVVAEQWANGSLSERVALERLLRPADWIGEPIVLRFTPPKWPKDFPPANADVKQALRTTALEQHEWLPVLTMGRDKALQLTIGDTGEVKKPRREEEMAQYGRETRDRANAAADLFNPSGKAPAAPAKPTTPLSTFLTATWIDYEIRVPGETPQKVRRAVFDLIGPSARAAGQIAAPRLDETAALTRSLALMMETEILPLVSRIPGQFTTHLAAQGLLANRDLLTTMARGGIGNDFAQAQEVAKRLVPMPTPLYGLARARFEWNPAGDAIYINRPNVLTRHVFFSPAPTESMGFRLQLATDIVANDVGVDLRARDPIRLRIDQGVLDTNAEAILVSERPNASNTAWAFDAPADWITLRSADDPQLATLTLPSDARRRIAEDLAAGNIVVAPKQPVAVGTDRFSGWWRVNPTTGQTLGMSETGWGQDLAEYAVIIGTVMATGFFFAYLWCGMGGANPTPMARAFSPSTPNLRLTALNYLVTPLEAAGTDCLNDAFVSALFAGLFAGIAGLLGGAGGFRVGGGGSAGRSGGAGRGGGSDGPDLSKTEPDLGDTLPGDPPPTGGRGDPQGGNPSGRGGNPSTSTDEPPNDWEYENERQWWEAHERQDHEGVQDAFRDSIRFDPERPNWTKWLMDPPKDKPPMGWNPPKPYTPPPKPPTPPPTSPFAKSIGGMGGVVDSLPKPKPNP